MPITRLWYSRLIMENYWGPTACCIKGPPPYRQLTEISLIMSGPGIGAGQTTHALSSHVDIVPTMFDLTGIPCDLENTDGKSLVPTSYGNGFRYPGVSFLANITQLSRNDVYNQTVQTLDWRLTIYPNQSTMGRTFPSEI